MSRILKQLGSLAIAFVLILVTFGFGFASPAHAEYLVKRAKMINVNNTSSNTNSFSIRVGGGIGPCANKTIVFPKEAVNNPNVYERAYVIALAAMENDWDVYVFDYYGDDCKHAGQIMVSK